MCFSEYMYAFLLDIQLRVGLLDPRVSVHYSALEDRQWEFQYHTKKEEMALEKTSML